MSNSAKKQGGQRAIKKYEVRYLPAPERIYGGESAVTVQRDLPLHGPETARRRRRTGSRTVRRPKPPP